MRKTHFWLLAAGACIPAIALATQPLLVHFDGRSLPMHETVQVLHDGAAMPTWALQQMRAMQAQMTQMQAIETSMNRQMLMPLQMFSTRRLQPLLLMPRGLIPVAYGQAIGPMPLFRPPLPVTLIIVPASHGTPPAMRAAQPRPQPPGIAI